MERLNHAADIARHAAIILISGVAVGYAHVLGISHKDILLDTEIKIPLLQTAVHVSLLLIALPILIFALHFGTLVHHAIFAGRIFNYTTANDGQDTVDGPDNPEHLSSYVFVRLRDSRNVPPVWLGFFMLAYEFIVLVLAPLGLLLLTLWRALAMHHEVMIWLLRFIVILDFFVIIIIYEFYSSNLYYLAGGSGNGGDNGNSEGGDNGNDNDNDNGNGRSKVLKIIKKLPAFLLLAILVSFVAIPVYLILFNWMGYGFAGGDFKGILVLEFLLFLSYLSIRGWLLFSEQENSGGAALANWVAFPALIGAPFLVLAFLLNVPANHSKTKGWLETVLTSTPGLSKLCAPCLPTANGKECKPIQNDRKNQTDQKKNDQKKVEIVRHPMCWLTWYLTEQRHGIRKYMNRNLQLEGIVLVDGDAANKSGTGTTLDLRYRDLRYADLAFTNMHGVDLTYADLEGMNAYRMSGAYSASSRSKDIQCDEDRTKNGQAFAPGSILERTNLSHGYYACQLFSNVNLRGANLSKANLQGAVFKNADLSGANLSGANMKGAAFREGVIIDAKTNFAGAIMPDTIADKEIYKGKNLVGVDFSNRNLEGFDFTEAHLELANFARADLSGAKFVKSWLHGTNFTEAQFKDTVFKEVGFFATAFYKVKWKDGAVKGESVNILYAHSMVGDFDKFLKAFSKMENVVVDCRGERKGECEDKIKNKQNIKSGTITAGDNNVMGYISVGESIEKIDEGMGKFNCQDKNSSGGSSWSRKKAYCALTKIAELFSTGRKSGKGGEGNGQQSPKKTKKKGAATRKKRRR